MVPRFFIYLIFCVPPMFYAQTQPNLPNYNQDHFPNAQKVQSVSHLHPKSVFCVPPTRPLVLLPR